MKITIDIDLSPEREKWATTAFQSVAESKETAAATVEEYIGSILKPSVASILDQVTDSWRPEDAPEVAAKRDQLASKIRDLPPEKLQEIEASIDAAQAAEAVKP